MVTIYQLIDGVVATAEVPDDQETIKVLEASGWSLEPPKKDSSGSKQSKED